ncbi:hypothetical protein ACIGC1_28680 [Peribacillus butanolivorans]|uniref:hypothetical protein n=1 Tax=Peribacillus butanolivorans TaxID=421767 RepID=UPI0037C975F9
MRELKRGVHDAREKHHRILSRTTEYDAKGFRKPNHGSIFFIKPDPLVLVHSFTNYIKEGFY